MSVSPGCTVPPSGVLGICDNRGMSGKRYDDSARRGIMNMTDAGRYLAISQQTFHRWAKGYEKGGALLHLADTSRPREASVSFITLTEAYVLQALRTAGVRVQKIRPALTKLQNTFGTEFALTAPNLATDGIDVLWDFSKTPGGAGLIEGRTGQTVMRTIVADYLTYITRDDGMPTRLQLPNCEPSKVIVDPEFGFGQPRFGVAGARLIDVAAMLKAGEEPEVVADEFGVSIHDVGTAARVLLGRAA